MNEYTPRVISTAQDALLMCDYIARFGYGEAVGHYAGIATVIRELMTRLEVQAAAMERSEAKSAKE